MALFALFLDLAKGMYDRPAVGHKARIESKKLPDGVSTLIRISDRGLADLCARRILEGDNLTPPGLSRPITVHRTIRHLVEWHSIEEPAPRLASQKGVREKGNREPKQYILRPFLQILEARRNDPKIATTHGESDPRKSRQWTNGRPRSNRPLTPEAAKMWGLAGLAAAGPTAFDAAATAATAVTGIWQNPADAAPITRQKPVDPPKTARNAAKLATITEEWEFPAFRERITRTVQEHLDALCFGNCDIAGEILANAEQTAHAKGKAFPVEQLVEACQHVLEKKLKRVPGRQGQFVLDVASPAAYLRAAMLDERPVLKQLDLMEHRSIDAAKKKKKADEALRDRICEQLGNLRKHPGDALVIELLEHLQGENPDLFERVANEEMMARAVKGASP